MMIRYLFLIIATLVPACFNEISDESSSVKHDLGKTSRTREEPMSSCVTPEPNEGLGEVVDYVRKVSNDLAKGNEDIFRDDLAIERFCFQVQGDSEISATADSRDGTITISPRSILNLESPAQLASILAHELAHVTMNHLDLDQHPDLSENNEYQELRKKLSNSDLSEDELSATQEKIKSLEREILGEESHDLKLNWKESEADDVGLEFYTKAGYGSLDYEKTFEKVSEIVGEDCGLNDAIRGSGSHPHICWRIMNSQSEIKVHDYPKYGKSHPEGLTEEDWEAVREDIKKYLEN